MPATAAAQPAGQRAQANNLKETSKQPDGKQASASRRTRHLAQLLVGTLSQQQAPRP